MGKQFALNDVQKKAVETVGKPILIFAGAGTGKTRVLTHKIAYLVQESGYKPEDILAVTFTNKAAQEMKARVKKLLGVSSMGVNIGTFHSTCARLLRKEIVPLGFTQDFAIYDANDQQELIKEVMANLKLSSDGVTPRSVRGRISLLKNQMESPAKAADEAISPFEEIVAKVFPTYANALKKNNALDFDDLLLYPLSIFDQYPKVRAKYQNLFKYVLVDEYQDTNRPQFLFVKALTENDKQICVVGDDDQSIYGWRGADISNILEFEKTFPDCEVFRLEQNYRSTQTILSSASEVVAHNQYRATKKLWTESKNGEKIGLMETLDEQEEAEGILELLEKEVMQYKRAFSDFVILYRTNAQSRALEEAFRRRGIAYTIVGGVKFYERKEVKDLLAYLRLLVNLADTVSLKRIINFPPRGIGVKTVDKCETYAAKKGLPLVEVLQSPDALDLKGKQATGLIEFYHIVKKYSDLLPKLSASELVSVLVDELGLISFYKEQANADASERLENVHELVNSVHAFCEQNEGAGIREFLEEVSLLTDIDKWEDTSNCVTLMTLHSAKGLEFPVVFIAGLEDGLFPIMRSFDDPRDLEEERRLFYVGLTRAKERAYLHYATNRRRSSGVLGYGMASRFLQEIPEESLDRITFQSAVTKRYVREKGSDSYALKQVRTVTSFNDLKRGDKVEHKIFGKGMILSVDGAGESQKISVVFRGNVRKKLIAKYANLRRL
ncbi:MAG: UvrD-helicase domain-containing protein [Candidatus Marinimicrobia bacterium]|jgi:DNA helicase-2/ATP-dependent DNA helicase PcrA|nr:UvrD-helicase domain-containing protein [Candidatus Neomarinimicrobiota bacterium]